jgi:site-specific DNA-methyltransferase (adenine-specific)
MAALEAGSVDTIVTDPPYGLEFMGKGWDKLARPKPGNLGGFATGDKPSFARVRKHLGAMLDWHAEWASAALRLAKPGAHLVAFGGTRTHQYLMLGLELAGWEIRDCLMWLYGSGFPKSHNLEGEWDGWGTALKPGWEPTILARKPLTGTVAATVREHGTGALNIDGCRIEGPKGSGVWGSSQATVNPNKKFNRSPGNPEYRTEAHPEGRWPANVMVDEEAAAALDAQSGELTSGANPTRRGSNKFASTYGDFVGQVECVPVRGLDVGGASRFFYCAKASRAEREAGLDLLPERLHAQSGGAQGAQGALARGEAEYQQESLGLNVVKRVRNHHPTVKPVALMRWLCRLVTPPGGLVLDPFAGSGTTGIACVLEGFRFLGIEEDSGYLAIAQARIAHAEQQPSLFEASA